MATIAEKLKKNTLAELQLCREEALGVTYEQSALTGVKVKRG